MFSTHLLDCTVASIESLQDIVCLDGSIVALWQENTEDNQHTIKTATHSAGVWSSSQLISSTNEISLSPKVVRDDQGNIVAGWFTVGLLQGVYVLYGAAKLVGSAWDTPVVLSSTDRQVQSFS